MEYNGVQLKGKVNMQFHWRLITYCWDLIYLLVTY